ncbi:hypothetical protein MKQ68_23635 [Chitinophaga horti]|uniref:Quinol oxidase subunit 4 n=1 Tax=Chitinophaga horti TaxID=2920382 RepID=A0ABY6J4E1_9BACT|nr:hypothetical protein [Chitinophaga horti]UYQ93077.1 hypothetical protein MKQ68_23635 [Chitinophaga horti]
MKIRIRHIVVMLAIMVAAAACRSTKTGCPTPKRNMGAEKVLDDMSKPPKKGLFKRKNRY